MEQRLEQIETNLNDLIVAVRDGFDHVEVRMEERFDKVENRLYGLEVGQEELSYRVTALEKRTGSLEDAVQDMHETLDGVAKAVDVDAVTILDHEERITGLEGTQSA